MRRKKINIDLFEFINTGKFGPFKPTRNISPEQLVEILGRPDQAYCCAPVEDYMFGQQNHFPVILSYGHIEFHFDAADRLLILYSDNFMGKISGGQQLRLRDTALLKYARSLDSFLQLSQSRQLSLKPFKEKSYAEAEDIMAFKTPAGVKFHFERDTTEEPFVLVAFCLDYRNYSASTKV